MNLFNKRKKRAVTFPQDSSLGCLYIPDQTGYRPFALAQGTVLVPEGARIVLRLSPDAADLSPLRLLRADDLSGLSLAHSYKTDDELLHVSSLTCLSSLHLDFTPSTGRGLASLKQVRLQFLSARHTHITDDGVTNLPLIDSLESVNFSTSRVTDPAVTRLAEFPAIKSLILWENRITCRAGQSLRQMRSLVELFLGGTRFGDAGAALIKDLPNLTCLELERTAVTDKALQELAQLPALISLGLSHTSVTDTGITALSSQLNLKRLRLSNTHITDGAITLIARMSELADLELAETALTDKSLSALATMPALKRVNLRGTNMSPEGVSWLRQQIPAVTVISGMQGRMAIPQQLKGAPFRPPVSAVTSAFVLASQAQ